MSKVKKFKKWKSERMGHPYPIMLAEEAINEQQARIAELEGALLKLIDVASQCDSWESFPSDDLDEATSAAIGEPRK